MFLSHVIDMKRKPRICMVCCPGGHFSELRLATKDINYEEYDIYWLTFKSQHLLNFLKDKRHHYVVNIEPSSKLSGIINIIQSLWFLIRERPDCIISTGSGMAFPTICLGKKIFGSKVIFICTAADVKGSTKTAKAAYRFSDLFCVQWPEMKQIYPNSFYIGTL